MSTPSATVRETTEQILRRLDVLPLSDRAKLLRVCALECVAEVEGWSAAPPSSRDLQALAKRLLLLHVEVTRLERGALAERTDGARRVN
jgi:hypothetical protein